MGWVPLQMISVTILTLALAPGLTGSSPAPGCVSCRYSMIATLWVRVRSKTQFLFRLVHCDGYKIFGREKGQSMAIFADKCLKFRWRRNLFQ